jgi:Flp pilus assembly protein TadD
MNRHIRWLAIMMVLLAAPLLQAQHVQKEGQDKESGPVVQVRRLFTQGQWKEAVAALREAEKALPGNEDLKAMSAMVAMENGDHAEALRLYNALLETYPNDASLKNNVAWLHAVSQDPQIRDLDLSLKLAQEAVMQADHDYNIWNTLGEIYLARGDAMRAMRMAVLARDMAALAGERDLRIYQDLVRRSEAGGR